MASQISALQEQLGAAEEQMAVAHDESEGLRLVVGDATTKLAAVQEEVSVVQQQVGEVQQQTNALGEQHDASSKEQHALVWSCREEVEAATKGGKEAMEAERTERERAQEEQQKQREEQQQELGDLLEAHGELAEVLESMRAEGACAKLAMDQVQRRLCADENEVTKLITKVGALGDSLEQQIRTPIVQNPLEQTPLPPHSPPAPTHISPPRPPVSLAEEASRAPVPAASHGSDTTGAAHAASAGTEYGGGAGAERREAKEEEEEAKETLLFSLDVDVGKGKQAVVEVHEGQQHHPEVVAKAFCTKHGIVEPAAAEALAAYISDVCRDLASQGGGGGSW
jgi:hypothetical protein